MTACRLRGGEGSSDASWGIARFLSSIAETTETDTLSATRVEDLIQRWFARCVQKVNGGAVVSRAVKCREVVEGKQKEESGGEGEER